MAKFGFPIRTKVNSGPKIKYFQLELTDAAQATAVANWFSENALNNLAKADMNQRLIIHGERDYEIPQGHNLADELWITVQLMHETEGVVDGTGFVTLPCLRLNSAETVKDYLVGKAQVQCTDNSYKPCTSAKVIKTTTYAV